MLGEELGRRGEVGPSLEVLARERSSWPSPLAPGELDLAGDAGKKGGGAGRA